MEEEKTISRERFSKLPKGKTENILLEVFEANPEKAFNYLALCKMVGLKKSTIYVVLSNLIKTELIEKRGEFYALK